MAKRKKPPELVFQKHIADYLVRKHGYAPALKEFATFAEYIGEQLIKLGSVSDTEVTRQLKQAGENLGIVLLDHIIFNRSSYFSFLEAGKL